MQSALESVTGSDESDEHGHDDSGEDESEEHLDLTDIEIRSIGLRTKKVELADFVRSVAVPGMVD